MDHQRLKALIDSVGQEMFPNGLPEDPSVLPNFSDSCDVIQAAFERDPEAFEGINSVENEAGLPIWVREGYDWQPPDDDDDYGLDLEDDDED